jgi:2-polyprenyl-3-methyl-5-hydroxy-6-metoxy-1,4-benzoquinol methylase
MLRVEQPELLELGHGTLADVQQNLNEMWRINRWLGGFSSLTRHLYPRLASSVTIADLGTGSAEALIAIQQWAQLHHINLNLIAVDWAPRHLNIARQHINGTGAIHLLRADANRLPFPPNSVDFIISSLFLHHFTPEQVIHVLRSSYAAARNGIIMNDLVRGWMPYTAFKLVQPVFARHYLTRHDGALSVRRAYTPDELRDLAQAAGLHNITIHTNFPWRMTLVADK